MANGSIESKGEGSVWPADDSSQSRPSYQQTQDLGTPGDPNDNTPQAAGHFSPQQHARPPSPISVAELQERAVQDSQNNNVDENSNDRHYDQYAAATTATYPSQEASSYPSYRNQESLNYTYRNREASSYPTYSRQETSDNSNSTRETFSHTSSSHRAWKAPHPSHSSLETQPLHFSREAACPSHQDALSHHYSHSSQDASCSNPSQEAAPPCDQSVRPRVRQPPRHHRNEPALPPQSPAANRRDSGINSSWQHSGFAHHRTHSEGMSAAARYPPLPNHNHAASELDGPLPNLPGLGVESQNPDSPSGWLPLALRGGGCSPQPPQTLPSAERVTQEAQELLTTFTSETLRNNRLEVPQCMLVIPSSSTPQMIRAGRELRLLADAFAGTAERRKVRLMAESVNLSCIEMDDFFQLCTELFYDGITRERIVALFTFVGDVAVHQVRMKGEELIHLLMKWSLRYLVEHVCRWVQEAGGWVAVLTCGANFLYRCAVFAFCVCGSVAASLFIYKTLKNG